MLRVYQDIYRPTLLNSPVLQPTVEQAEYIKKVLLVGSSDSRFAEKAWDAILFILSSGSVSRPVITSLNPPSAVLGSPPVELHVTGTDFTEYSSIVWDGDVVPTTFVSNTELSATVDIPGGGAEVRVAPTSVSVMVYVDRVNIVSQPVSFALTSAEVKKK